MSNTLVSDAELENALNWLGKADSEYRDVRIKAKASEELKKSVLAKIYLSFDGTAKDKEMKAFASKEYQETVISMVESQDDYESFKLKKLYNETVIEVWRTLQANFRKGNI